MIYKNFKDAEELRPEQVLFIVDIESGKYEPIIIRTVAIQYSTDPNDNSVDIWFESDFISYVEFYSDSHSEEDEYIFFDSDVENVKKFIGDQNKEKLRKIDRKIYTLQEEIKTLDRQKKEIIEVK